MATAFNPRSSGYPYSVKKGGSPPDPRRKGGPTLVPPDNGLSAVDMADMELHLAGSLPPKFDSHRAMAAVVFNVRYSDVTEEQRRATKALSYSTAYGNPMVLFRAMEQNWPKSVPTTHRNSLLKFGNWLAIVLIATTVGVLIALFAGSP